MNLDRTAIILIVIALLVGAGLGVVLSPGPTQSEEASDLRAEIAALQAAFAEGVDLEPRQRLLSVNAKISIPLQRGYYNGDQLFYISTEASDEATASAITQRIGFPVTFAPAIANVPRAALANFFVFTNGIDGDGVHGYQPEVFDSIPGDPNYSPAWLVNNVGWIDGADVRELTSVEEVIEARQEGQVLITMTDIVVNCPFVRWPGGELPTFQGVHDDNSGYGQAQVLSIDTDGMEVVFRAHRGWAQDGSQIAYIVTDASLDMPAQDMGVVHAEITQNMLNSDAASDLWQYGNGIIGSGPMGFQAGISASKPGDPDYSPFWSIRAIVWNDPSQAVILESVADIDLAERRGLIGIDAMMGGMIVNCPFVPVSLLE